MPGRISKGIVTALNIAFLMGTHFVLQLIRALGLVNKARQTKWLREKVFKARRKHKRCESFACVLNYSPTVETAASRNGTGMNLYVSYLSSAPCGWVSQRAAGDLDKDQQGEMFRLWKLSSLGIISSATEVSI